MRNQGLIPALTCVTVISIIIISSISFTIYHMRLIGPVIIILGFIPWIPLRFFRRTIKSVGADIAFGAIDTGILGIAALVGASFAGVTDGFAGLGEGKVAQYLRKYGIEEARTPLSASMGKMSGCLLGVGFILTLVWSILGLNIGIA
jgi:hypothetical protein